MLVLAGSPFAPDAASDWWNFAVNVFIGLATLAALVLNMIQTRIARAEAREATRTADRAANQEALRERRDAERDRQVRIEGLRQRAARQALSVWTKTLWRDGDDGSRQFAPFMRNDSDEPIWNVVIRWHYDEGKHRKWTAEYLRPKSGGPLQWQSAVKYGLTGEQQLPLVVEFTDVYADRWVLGPDGSIEIMHERTFRLPGD